MELYNSLINETKALLESKSAKVWDYDAHGLWKDTGMSELVLQKDAAFELGASGKGSANYVLFTSMPSSSTGSGHSQRQGSRRAEGRLRFCPALSCCASACWMRDDEAVYRTLKDIEFSSTMCTPRGYMVRMSPESYREQIRVSKDALRHGISFKSIGMNYITEYKKDANVISATVIFMTDPSIDYAKLKALAKKIR